MATRKSTTAKSKTTKRAAKPAATKARASKVKTVARPAPKAQAKRWAFLTLNRIWAVAAVLFVGLAVATPFLMQSVSYGLSQTHLTSDVLLSRESTVFIPASRAVMDLELRWVLTALLAAWSILPILYLTKLKDRYAARLAKGRIWELRWVDFAVSGALMVEIIAILCGYTDLATLKLMAGSVVLAGALSWLAEQQNAAARRPVWSAFGLSILAVVMPWLAIGIAKTHTLLFGAVRSPWYVYALCLTTLAGFILVALNQWQQHRRTVADYAVVERNYALVSVVTKLAFAGILIVGFLK